jgi:Flp pilus assembly protein TadG
MQRTWQDERGFSMVFVAVGLAAFLAATTLAIDVGMFMTARAQAQNAADAGALAGAVALAFDDFDNRTASGPAVQNAIQTASANQVMARAVSVTPGDVTFPNDPNGRPTWVHVEVFRTSARGNPVATLMGTLLRRNWVDVRAMATAQAAPANAETCVKPFTIPDKWVEKQTGSWDPDDTFDLYDNKGRPLANPDVYIPSDQPGYTGYNAERDKGTQLVLKAAQGENIAPSFYNPIAIGTSSGAEDYRWNIENCNTTVMGFGDPLVSEPGNMVGPTKQGMDGLIAKDPDAYWDTTNNRVVSSMHPSPRVAIIPVYDPVYYAEGKHNSRNADLKVVNYIGFFIEGMQGNSVMGRITPVSGIMNGNGGPAPSGAFPRVIRLVQ